MVIAASAVAGCGSDDRTEPQSVADTTASSLVRVPQDAATLTEAANLVAPGGTILIGAGNYPEQLLLDTPDVTVRGADRNATVIDGRAMFVTNLSDKSIYGINIADPDVTPTAAVPFDTPVGSGQQLWAVTTYRNRLYLGYVDTGTRPGLSAAAAGMKAYVVSTAVDDMVDAVVRGTRLTTASTMLSTAVDTT